MSEELSKSDKRVLEMLSSCLSVAEYPKTKEERIEALLKKEKVDFFHCIRYYYVSDTPMSNEHYCLVDAYVEIFCEDILKFRLDQLDTIYNWGLIDLSLKDNNPKWDIDRIREFCFIFNMSKDVDGEGIVEFSKSMTNYFNNLDYKVSVVKKYIRTYNEQKLVTCIEKMNLKFYLYIDYNI